MPCPFFFPLRKLGPGAWDPAPRWPLGAAWSGECRAALQPVAVGGEQELCNTGYARGQCAHFPQEADADAVRFAHQGGGLIYILEKDHAPVEHGEMILSSGFREILAAQARAFLESADG